MPTNTTRRPTSASDPIPEIDLVDPDPLNTSGLDDLFEGLRQEHSVFWHGPKSRPGFWAVIRYAEAVRVYRDSETFSATHGMTIDSLRSGPDPASGMMVEVTDPPEHRRLRRSIGTFFTGGAIAGLAEPIDRYAASLLGEIRDTVDFVDAVACRIPTYSAGLVLGLPREDLEWITARTSKVFLGGTAELREAASQANAELLTYFAKLVRAAGRGSGTGDGFVQRLAAGSTTRDGLTTGEVVLNALNLAIGGTQTTRNVLTNLMHALLVHPGVLPALREAPSAVPTAVEEVVRWANPVRHLTRVATRDVELGGRRVSAGDPVAVWPRSANRDETVFPHAREFDIHRHPNPHIGFAAGPHSCPGTGLARTQARATLRHLSELFDDVRPAGPGELLRSNFLHGYASLPVRFTTRP